MVRLRYQKRYVPERGLVRHPNHTWIGLGVALGGQVNLAGDRRALLDKSLSATVVEVDRDGNTFLVGSANRT